ncbi:MAG: sulfatase-like hydrolase/transferase [Rhodobacter sp.]|nr:sulfatase-like hydrolase/transferase [Rhodobacter sp.]
MAGYDIVLLVSCDTLRFDAIASHPAKHWPKRYRATERLNTPHLDDLAARGAHFLEARSAAPYTSASHGTIFSGRWPLETGLHEYLNGDLAARTLFHAAKDLGYRTAFKTDFPFVLGDYLGFTKAVDDYVVEGEFPVLPLLSGSDPVFMFYHFADVHMPYGYSSYDDSVESLDAQVAAMEAAFDLTAPPQVDRFVETFLDGARLDQLLRYKAVIEALYLAGDYDKLFDLYLAGINRFDAGHFQRFLDEVFERTKGKRVLIVLFGDHGEDYSAESYGHYNSVTEGALQVPLILFGDDIAPNRIAEPVRTVDIAPTVIELIGGDLPNLSGHSLVPLMRGESQPPAPAYAQTYTANSTDLRRVQNRLLERKSGKIDVPHHLTCECIYDGPWKLVKRHLSYVRSAEDTELVVNPDEELHLTRRGPDGLYEPADDVGATARLAEMLSAYNRRANLSERTEKPKLDEAMRRQMQALGYRI